MQDRTSTGKRAPLSTIYPIVFFRTKIDPSEEDTRNDLSHYTLDGQTLWSRAYTYCTADSPSSLECDEGARFVEAAKETLPEYLSAEDGGFHDANDYEAQVRWADTTVCLHGLRCPPAFMCEYLSNSCLFVGTYAAETIVSRTCRIGPQDYRVFAYD